MRLNANKAVYFTTKVHESQIMSVLHPTIRISVSRAQKDAQLFDGSCIQGLTATFRTDNASNDSCGIDALINETKAVCARNEAQQWIVQLLGETPFPRHQRSKYLDNLNGHPRITGKYVLVLAKQLIIQSR